MESDHPVNQRLETYLTQTPTIGEEVYIAKSAVVFGVVTLGDRASVWYLSLIHI